MVWFMCLKYNIILNGNLLSNFYMSLNIILNERLLIWIYRRYLQLSILTFFIFFGLKYAVGIIFCFFFEIPLVKGNDE